ncbi:MAG: 50S ribosomal protein L4 [Bacteriovoracaceae bacterium]|nr:50S ribosomal protein L4 [Bacteriovoracaceae bacterium]
MTELNVLNNKFENKEKIKVDLDFTPEAINVPVVHQVVKATLASRRQGNACTKTKAEVSGGGKKPFKQKGTGNARQGSTRSPLMPGGGTVFGPRPRSYEQKVNKKVVLNALRSVLVDKHLAGKLLIVDSLKSTGKTKEMATLLGSKNLLNALVVTLDSASLAIRATNNLKTAKGLGVDNMSVYEAVKYENLIIEKLAFERLANKLV